MSMQLHHTLMSQYKHGTVSGIGSVSYDSVANCVTPEIVIYGKCIQDGTPTPDVPVEIVANNNVYEVNKKWDYTIPELYGVMDVYQVGAVRDEYYPQTGKVIRRCKKVTLSSSDNLTDRSNDSRGICFDFRPDNVIAGHRTSLCSHFKNVSATWGNANKGNIGEYSDNDVNGWKFFRPPNDSIDTLDKFKAWLDEQVAIGKPVTLVYVLAEPVIEYVDPVQLTSVRGTNIIEESDNELDVIYGECIQDGTPTPDAPVDIVGNNKTYTVCGNTTVTAPDLLSVGNVRDEYYPLTGKIIRRCKKIILDASMDMTIKKWVDGELGISFTNAVPNSGASVGNTMCSHEDSFDTIFSSLGSLGGHVMSYGGSSTNLMWYGILDALGMTTIDEFKEWLTAQSDAGTPVTVVYKFEEPVIEYVEPVPCNMTGTQIDVKYLTHS